MKKNEQLVNKALPVQVHNPATCMVSAPICPLPPSQNTGATGNCALRKICLLQLESEIRSKAVKIHGKSVLIFVSVRKERLRESMTFPPGISFWSASSPTLGPNNSSSRAPWPGSTLSHLQVLCHYSLLSLPCGDPMEPDPGVKKNTLHLQAKE